MRSPLVPEMPIALVIAATVLAIGCEKKGPAERAGEHLDRAIDELRDAAKSTTT